MSSRKTSKSRVSASKLVNTPIDSSKSLEPAKFREIGGRSKQPLGYAIGTSGLLARHVLTLWHRVCVGSWRREDGTRGYHYGWFATYETECVGIPMIGYSLVNENEMTLIKPRVVRQAHQQLTFAEFVQRKEKAA